MYRDTITLFNYYRGTWYPTVLTGVDLNADRAAIVKQMGAESEDRAKLHIRFTLPAPRYGDAVYGRAVYGCATPTAGTASILPPRLYCGTEGTITLRTGEDGETPDFFIEGTWSEEPVRDADYPDGFFTHMLTVCDACFALTSAARYSVIPHYEILAR